MLDDQNVNHEAELDTSDLDSQMASAWDEVLPSSEEEAAPVEGSEVANELEVAPEKPGGSEPPEDNKESSRLGRKVKEQEDKIGRLENLIGQMLAAAQKPASVDEDAPKMPDYTTTWEDIKQAARAEQYQQTKAQQQYTTQYYEVLGKIGKAQESEDVHKEVVGLMMATVKDGSNTFNRTFGGGPAQDAITNYAAAEAAYWRSKASGGKPAFGRQEVATGTAVAGSSKEAKAAKPLPKMDAASASLLKGLRAMGATDAEIAEALAG
jgi:hypothetical protein